MRRSHVLFIRFESRAAHQARPIYIYIYTVRYEGKEEEGVEKGERNVRTRHFQVGTIESLSIWRRWIEITRDRNGRRKDWEVEMDGIERIRAREQSRKIVADSADLGAGDIWISTRRSWKPRKQASKGFDSSSIKILSIFRATADPGDQTQFQSTSLGREALNTSGTSRRDVMELMGKLWMGPRNSSCLAYKER